MKQTGKTALCGILSAAALVCLMLTVIPSLTYALPPLASVFFIPIVIECGKRWALVAYIGVALLSLFLTPDLEARVLFIVFFGYYPLLKSIFESRLPRVAEWLCKLAVFNAAVLGGYRVLMWIGLSLDEFALPGVPLPLTAILGLFLLAANVIFVIYDIGLTRLLPLYFRRIRPALYRQFRF